MTTLINLSQDFPQAPIPSLITQDANGMAKALAFRWVCIMEYGVDPIRVSMEDLQNWAEELSRENKNPAEWTIQECIGFLGNFLDMPPLEDY